MNEAGRTRLATRDYRIGAAGDRTMVIAKYERWLADQHDLLRAFDELRRRNLLCWCLC
jgi:Domain of unknown function (DUF4326)